MIIRSKFVDYYDHFLSHGQRDPKIVYDRVPRLSGVQVPKDLTAFTRNAHEWGISLSSNYVGFVLLGGKVYPFYLQTGGESRHLQLDYTSPYSKFEEATANYKTRSWRGFQERTVDTIECGTEHQTAVELNQTLAPVILWCPVYLSFYPIWAHEPHKGMTLNPRLQDLQFPMNGHQVNQEIMATLAAKEPEMVKSSDEVRAQAHGMDNTSFRREPGGPTRKRKKLEKL